MLAGNSSISLAGSEEQIIFFQQSPKMLKIVSENFIHALLLFLGLFLKISRWVPPNKRSDDKRELICFQNVHLYIMLTLPTRKMLLLSFKFYFNIVLVFWTSITGPVYYIRQFLFTCITESKSASDQLHFRNSDHETYFDKTNQVYDHKFNLAVARTTVK